MEDFDVDDMCQRALHLWGVDSQLLMVEEECLELALALKHWRRGKCSVVEVARELADVEVVIRQLLIILLGTGEAETVADARKSKLGKFKRYLDESN